MRKPFCCSCWFFKLFFKETAPCIKQDKWKCKGKSTENLCLVWSITNRKTEQRKETVPVWNRTTKRTRTSERKLLTMGNRTIKRTETSERKLLSVRNMTTRRTVSSVTYDPQRTTCTCVKCELVVHTAKGFYSVTHDLQLEKGLCCVEVYISVRWYFYLTIAFGCMNDFLFSSLFLFLCLYISYTVVLGEQTERKVMNEMTATC